MAAFQEAQAVYLYSAYRQRSQDQDIGGPAEEVRFPSLDARQVAPGIWVGRDHSIHPSAKIAAPIYIGAHSWVGREAELGPATVVGTNVVIDEEATVSRSTVLSGTYVGRLLNVDERVVTPHAISDSATGETTRIIDPFLVGPVGAVSAEPGPLSRGAHTVTALALLVLLSPLLLLLGLLSLLTTGGVLVRSPRVGERSRDSAALRTFQILRFRTRRGGELTAIGRLVERLELHRLLELVNVLRGDMTLVGVKPLRPEEAALLTEEWHQRRHERSAGFTGLWYLQTERESDFDAVIVADVYYTATRTGRGDVLCLLRTPRAWVRRIRAGLEREGEGEYLVQAG
jgi:lipopolysaccharide/colanic/teichoic acid biosynthesis glycosyltransferase